MFYQNAYKQIQMLVYRVPCTILDACLAFDYNMCAKLKYFVYSSSLVQANALKYVCVTLTVYLLGEKLTNKST